MFSASHSIRRKYFANKQSLLFSSSESESLELNDVTVDFILVAPHSADDTVGLGGWNIRRVFEEEIKTVGLLLEEDDDDELVFVKIHVPTHVLRKYCEIMKLRMPIKESLVNNSEKEDVNNDRFRQYLGICMANTPKSKILTAEYSSGTSYLFNEKDPDFFSEEVRTLVIDFILNKINWGREKDNLSTVGFQSLIDKGVYKAAYALHDGDLDFENSRRHWLLTEWASVDKCFYRQPIDEVKKYMGVKYAFYFAWLGFYTYSLIPAAVMGVIVILYGVTALPSNRLSSDICNATDTIMCPLCDNYCDYWQLSTACWDGKLSNLFDNDLTVIFAFLMSIWATLSLEMWKRYASVITRHWGLTHFNLDLQQPRPQYLAKLSHLNQTKNVLTGEIEPVVPFRKKMSVLFISYSILLLSLMITIAFVLAVVIYRMAVISSGLTKSYPFINIHLFISFTSGILNLFCIQLLNWIYGKIAVFLTEIELPRTQQEFDETLQVKIYVFKFINSYTSIFYVAFWKGKWTGYPGNYLRIFNFRQEECNPGGCLIELSIQLFIIMVGQQILNAIIEMLYPAFELRFCSRTESSELSKRRTPSFDAKSLIAEKKPWLEDYKLLDLGPRGLLPEYLEMVLQYGFVTLFATAFPLSALFALLNNVFELRLDAKKLLNHYRRPIPHRVPDIGVWYRILDVIGIMSVVTNVGTIAIIIAFDTNVIPRLVYAAYASPDHTDRGYVDHSLAHFNVSDFRGSGPSRSSFANVTECRFQGYRQRMSSGRHVRYDLTAFYYQLLAARLLFIVLFQNVVYLVKIIIQWLIPDVPKSLRDRIKQESYLITRMIMEREAKRENINSHKNRHE